MSAEPVGNRVKLDASEPIASSIARATTEWVRTHPNGGDFQSLRRPFELLLSHLTAKCSWAVTSVKSGERPIFFPLLSKQTEDRNRDARLITGIMHRLGSKNEIVTTTDLCRSLLKESSILVITNLNLPIEAESKKWTILSKSVIDTILADLNTYKKHVINLDGVSYADNLNALKKKLSKVPDVDVIPPHVTGPEHELENQLSQAGFKLYLAILTVLNPDWKRIVMLPTVTPPCHFHHPGGLVICEDSENLIGEKELTRWQEVSSIPFWPWMLTARTTDRGDSHFQPKLRHLTAAASNDYRHLEHIFGGESLTLTDDLPANQSQVNSQSVNALVDTVKKAIGDRAKTNRKWVGASISLDDKGRASLDYSGVSPEDFWSEVRDPVLNSLRLDPTRNQFQEQQDTERRDRIAGMSIYGGPYSKVSIIVPIEPTLERIRNFSHCLDSYNFQTAITKYPRNFELVVLVDSDKSKNDELRTKVIQQLKESINNQPQLLKIDQIQVWMSNHYETIGRSSIRNFGIAKATGNVIQLFDDSMLLHSNYLMEVLIRFEFLVGQKFVLIGFKERLGGDQRFISTIKDLLKHNHIRPDYTKDWKLSEKVKAAFSHAFEYFPHGVNVDYHKMTGNLCFANGDLILGHRKLTHFFTTAQVAFWKDEFVSAGGFHPSFNARWGLEDTYMGAKLIARGNKIVPCFSAAAFDLQHTKDAEKVKLKTENERPKNQGVLDELNDMPVSAFGSTQFRDDVEMIQDHFEKVSI